MGRRSGDRGRRRPWEKDDLNLEERSRPPPLNFDQAEELRKPIKGLTRKQAELTRPPAVKAPRLSARSGETGQQAPRQAGKPGGGGREGLKVPKPLIGGRAEPDLALPQG